MKLNVFLFLLFLSIVIYASINFPTGYVGATKLNGEGCACHSTDITASVKVWVEGSGDFVIGETKQYTIYLSGGAAVLGGFNVAARSGFLSPADTSVIKIDDELTHSAPLPFPSTDDTISWTFYYTPVTEGWDTIYSVANSVNGNGIPTGDEWNFGSNFLIHISSNVPVELVSFSAVPKKQAILLEWQTATELNNNGFEIQRSFNKDDFITIGFVKGNGTTTTLNKYSFLDSPLNTGTYFYRLKQVDFDGTFSYSGIVSTKINPNSFVLSQNFPNPFNPETIIFFSIPEEGHLNLKIYNIQGEAVDILSDKIMAPGNHSIKWNASRFSSGVYFYKLNFVSISGLKISSIKKMVLAK